MSLGEDEVKEKESLYYKINNLDRRIIWWFLMIVLLIILIRPIGIPISITQPTRDAADFLMSLEPGSVVLFSQDNTATVNLAIGESVIDLMRYMLENDIKFIILSLQQAAVSTTHSSLNAVPNIDTYEYGVDYAQFGYYSGGINVAASLQNDVWGTLGSDIDGTPCEDLPIMQNLRKATDFDAWIETGGGGEFEYYIKNWAVTFGVPGITAQTSANLPAMTTWLKNELLQGFISDQRGTVEFTKLLGYPSKFVAMLDAQSVGHMILIVLIIVGNIFYINEKTRGEM